MTFEEMRQAIWIAICEHHKTTGEFVQDIQVDWHGTVFTASRGAEIPDLIKITVSKRLP